MSDSKSESAAASGGESPASIPSPPLPPNKLVSLPLNNRFVNKAAREGNLEELIKLHCDLGYSLEHVDYNCTPLLEASKNGHFHIVEYLIKNGVNVDKDLLLGNDGALNWAIIKGDEKITRALIAAGADINAIGGVRYLTPLIAALRNHSENSPKLHIAMALIEAGADINLPCSDSFCATPLIEASANGFVEIVRELIKRKADLNIRARFIGDNYRHIGHALMTATLHGHEAIVSELIAAGSDLNIRYNESGDTSLMIAARYAGLVPSHENIARQLIAAGADIHVTNNSFFNGNQHDGGGYTALMWACVRGSESIVEQLLSVGADVHVRDTKFGETLLHKVVLASSSFHESTRQGNRCYNPHSDIWDALKSKGAYDRILRLLIRSGVDVDATSRVGFTPLMLAVMGDCRSAIVELLVEGADDTIEQNQAISIGHTYTYYFDNKTVIVRACNTAFSLAVENGRLYASRYIWDSIKADISPRRVIMALRCALDTPDTTLREDIPVPPLQGFFLAVPEASKMMSLIAPFWLGLTDYPNPLLQLFVDRYSEEYRRVVGKVLDAFLSIPERTQRKNKKAAFFTPFVNADGKDPIPFVKQPLAFNGRRRKLTEGECWGIMRAISVDVQNDRNFFHRDEYSFPDISIGNLVCDVKTMTFTLNT
jgi:ankyrin repeat protein